MSRFVAPPPVQALVTTPNLRLQRGAAAAEAIAREHGIDLLVARKMVRAVQDEIERGSARVGFQCAGCGRLFATNEPCPDHGPDDGTRFPALPTAGLNRLLVAYDKVSW